MMIGLRTRCQVNKRGHRAYTITVQTTKKASSSKIRKTTSTVVSSSTTPAKMLPPLNPRVLDAFVGDLDDLDDLKYQFVGQAKSSLNIFRNLSWGTQFLLWTHGEFQARLYDDRSTMKNDGRGATEWHIRFRVCIQRGVLAKLD